MTVFEVLAEPHRRQMLDLLRRRERHVGELVRELQISQPAVSRHLRVLREAGFVQSQVDAQRRIYSVRAEPLRELDEWLEPYRAIWNGSLDALEHELERMGEPGRREHGGPEGKRRRKTR